MSKLNFLVVFVGLLLTACSTQSINTDVTFSRNGVPFTPPKATEAQFQKCVGDAKAALKAMGFGWFVTRWEKSPSAVRDSLSELSRCQYILEEDKFNPVLQIAQNAYLLGSIGKMAGTATYTNSAMLNQAGDKWEFLTDGTFLTIPLYHDTPHRSDLYAQVKTIPFVSDTEYFSPKKNDFSADVHSSGLHDLLAYADNDLFYHKVNVKLLASKRIKAHFGTATTLQENVILIDLYLRNWEKKEPKQFKEFLSNADVKKFLNYHIQEVEKAIGSAPGSALVANTEKLNKVFISSLADLRKILK